MAKRDEKRPERVERWRKRNEERREKQREKYGDEGRVGKKYMASGELRKDISNKRAQRLKKRGKDANIYTQDAGKSHYKVKSIYGRRTRG